MLKPLSLLCLPLLFSAGAHARTLQTSTAPQSATTPLPAPQVFAPGVISGPGGDGSPTFSPDGNTLLFTRSAARWSIILESHRVQGQWSEPAIASFSGQWSDSSPAMAPDGSYLVFVSQRPLAEATEKAPRVMASHIWRVQRTPAGWGEPIELPAAVNAYRFLFRPSVAADGTLYFTAQETGKELHLFRSLYKDGIYQPAEALTFSDGKLKDVDPEIAPDQSFLIFTSLGRGPSDPAHEKLYIVHAEHGVWGSILPLRYSGDDANGSSDDNDPRLGNDHRTLYFSSDRAAVVHFPRAASQVREDYQRLQTWDNGNTNIWVLPLSTP